MFVEQMQSKPHLGLSTDGDYDRNERPIKSFVAAVIFIGSIIYYFIELFEHKINILYFNALLIRGA